MQVLGAALPWIVGAMFGIYITRQCRRPSGPVGKMFARMMNRTHEGLTSWALSHLTIDPGETILDVGCGGGKTIERLASLAARGKVYGVDYSVTSVTMARGVNARLIATDRVDIQQASVSALPFADESFGVVTAIETHYYWPDLVHDFGEILRVLSPGGRLMVVAEAYDRGGVSALQKPAMALLKAKFLSREEHCRLLAAAGFASVDAFEERSKGWLCVVGTKSPTA
jgi:SAM-dependent methyltransferase